jgi:hypothetical protein
METVHLTIKIDKQLRTDFQVACKKADTTATAEITKFIENYLNEKKNDNK